MKVDNDIYIILRMYKGIAHLRQKKIIRFGYSPFVLNLRIIITIK